MLKTLLLSSALAALLCGVSCGSDSDADRLGVGAECVANDECDEDTNQECLPDFAGGYCGIRDCTSDLDCPEDSACIDHTNGTLYCFRTCQDKAECNDNRVEANWSNCSANVEFTDGALGRKACVPPSSGL